jgi:hypothetical protein
MGSVNVDTKDLDRIIRNVTDVKNMLTLSKGLTPNLKKALDNVGKRILETIKKETPVGDETRPDFHVNSKFHQGQKHLRDMWKWKLEVKGTKLDGFAYVDTKGANNLIDLLEAGSPRHTITARPGSVLRFYVRSGSGWDLAYSKSVDHPGFRANKFTDRAQDKSKIHIEKLSGEIQKEINRLLLRK